MSRLGIGARPLVTIDGYQFTDETLWQTLRDERTCYSTETPFVTARYFPKAAPDRSNGYNPPSIIDTSNTVPVTPIGNYLPDSCWIFTRLKHGFHGYGQREDYFGPIFVNGGKFLSLKFEIVDGTPTVRGYHSVSGGFSFGSDFLPGALAVVGVMATAGAIGTALGAPPTILGAGVVGPVGTVPLAPAAVADIVPFVGPIEPLVTTSPGWTLAETAAAAKAVGTSTMEGVKVLNQVAGAVGAVAAVSAAIQGPSGGSAQAPAPAPAPAPEPDSVGEKFTAVFDDLKTQLSSVDKKTWYMVGGVVVLLSLG